MLYHGHVPGIFVVSFHLRRGLETPKSLCPAVDFRHQHTSRAVARRYLWLSVSSTLVLFALGSLNGGVAQKDAIEPFICRMDPGIRGRSLFII